MGAAFLYQTPLYRLRLQRGNCVPGEDAEEARVAALVRRRQALRAELAQTVALADAAQERTEARPPPEPQLGSARSV